MGTKGVRSRRGRGELYEQKKDQKVIILLTKQGRLLLNDLVQNHPEKLSRSEYIERYVRGTL